MKITIYTIAIDDDCGTRTEIFTSDEARDAWAWENVVAHNFVDLAPINTLEKARAHFGTAHEAIHEGGLRKYEDTYAFDEHEIAIVVPAPAKKYLVPLDLSSGIQLDTYDSEEERDTALWEMAWNGCDTTATTIDEFKEEHADDLADAMEDAEIGYVTEDIEFLTKPKVELPAVRRFLDLSTAHLSQEAVAWLNTQGQENSSRVPFSNAPLVATHHVGWFMYAGHDDGYHDCLKPIIKHAMAIGCDYVNFDADASAIDVLPTFDW